MIYQSVSGLCSAALLTTTDAGVQNAFWVPGLFDIKILLDTITVEYFPPHVALLFDLLSNWRDVLNAHKGTCNVSKQTMTFAGAGTGTYCLR